MATSYIPFPTHGAMATTAGGIAAFEIVLVARSDVCLPVFGKCQNDFNFR